MSTQNVISHGESVAERANNNVDADATEKSPNKNNAKEEISIPEKESTPVNTTATVVDQSNTLGNENSKSAETPPQDECIANAAVTDIDDANAENSKKEEVSNSNSNGKIDATKSQGQIIDPTDTNQHDSSQQSSITHAKNNDALEASTNQPPVEVTKKADDETVDAQGIDSSQEPKKPLTEQHHLNPLDPHLDDLETNDKISNVSVENKNNGPTAAEATEKASVADSQKASIADSQTGPSAEIIEKLPTITSDSRETDSRQEPKTDPSVDQHHHPNPLNPSTDTVETDPKPSNGSTENTNKPTATTLTEKASIADSPKVDSCNRPSSTRSRARSLSSAVSSLSGGGSVGDHSGGILSAIDRKRHKRGPTALFRKNSETAESPSSLPSRTAADIISREETATTTVLPPMIIENSNINNNNSNNNEDVHVMRSALSPPGVTFAITKRPRSNTVESFRAAMDSQYGDYLPTESILLPEMKDPDMKEGEEGCCGGGGDDMDNIMANAREVEDIIGLSDGNSSMLLPVSPGLNKDNNPLSSPTGVRCRSDTIDFLTSAVDFDEVDDYASAVEDGDSIHPTPINATKTSNDSTENDKSTLLTTEKVESNLQNKEISSKSSEPTKDCRSDTIDFLTSAVEFRVDDNVSSVEDGKEVMHPTPINVTQASSDKDATIGTTKKVEINLQIQESSSSKSDGNAGENILNINPRSQSNGMGSMSQGDNDSNEGLAFGKTPKKTNLSRTRSQSSIGSSVLPETKDPGIKVGDDDNMNNVSDTKKVEDVVGSSSINNNSNQSPLLLRSSLDSLNPLTSPRGRCRSDTIDFLTSAVEFQVDDDDPAVGDGEDIHPTPINAPKTPTNIHPAPINVTKTPTNSTENDKSITVISEKVEIHLQNQETSAKSNLVGEISDKETTKVPSNGMNKVVAFGKTPKKTNISRARSQSSLVQPVSMPPVHGPLRKRYRTRSLSFALPRQEAPSSASKPIAPPEKMKQGEATAKSATTIGEPKRDEIIAGRRYRTRSLSFALSDGGNSSFKGVASPKEPEESYTGSAMSIGTNEDGNATESDTNSSGRKRSNTLDSIHAAVFGNRSRSDTLNQYLYGELEEEEGEKERERRDRSDTLEFLTAAVAGDMGHDLDAAMAAAGDDGASFTVHTVSAPSGASVRYNNSHNRAPPPLPPGQKQRPRSDTLDSTASSINSAKLDFMVSVASEQGVLDPIHGAQEAAHESVGDSSDLTHHRGRPRSNTLEIYSNMNSTSRARNDSVDFLLGSNDGDDPVGTRARGDTMDFLCGANDNDEVGHIDDVVTLPEDNGDDHTEHNSNVMDHLKALCDEPKINGSKTARILRRKRLSSTDLAEELSSPRGKGEGVSAAPASKRARKNSEATWKTNFSTDSFMNSLTRNRLESWGGMSDLSVGGAMGCSSAMAATHTALKGTGILDDLLAAAADLGGDDDLSESVSGGGDKKSNLECKRQIRAAASGGSNSLSGAPAAVTETTQPKPARPRLESAASISLGELSDSTPVSLEKPVPVPKAASKEASESVGTPSITVDYGAIAAAVNAANAATEGMDLAAIMGTQKNNQRGVNTKLAQSKYLQATKIPSRLGAPLRKTYVPQSALRRSISHSQKKPPFVTSTPGMKAAPQGQKFPVTTINIPFVPIPKSTKTKEEMDAIRARARAAAGYVPPPKDGKTPSKTAPPRKAIPATKFHPHANPHYRPGVHPTHIPIKKRGMPHPPNPPPGMQMMPDGIRSNISHQSPLSYMKPAAQGTLSYMKPQSSARGAPSATLQSQQKWDDMFECLVHFIEETREKCTKCLSDAEKATWIWDGNVPTSYKTPCGKALGRWINNQRSAKAKGTLKDDREVRLVSTGLKWSVLTTNSWRQMVRELEIYVNEQTKNGQMWDGNVPTNYKIKSNFPTVPGAEDADDEKNLGRWVNRQRSLFQAGKLKKDRQRDLERIGLKWSVLLTTSWSTMFESLKVYAEEKRKASPHNTWDGNVPANFKTRTNPPLSLGRWVNRQRSAFAKGRLKQEYVEKLEVVGLKWVIHTRHVRTVDNVADAADENDDFDAGEFVRNNNNLAQQKSAVAPSNGIMLNGTNSLQQVSSLPPLPPLPPPG